MVPSVRQPPGATIMTNQPPSSSGHVRTTVDFAVSTRRSRDQPDDPEPNALRPEPPTPGGARADEPKSSAAPTPNPRRTFGTGRMEAFSDGVFAIAITLIALEIVIPGNRGSDLLKAVVEQWPSGSG